MFGLVEPATFSVLIESYRVLEESMFQRSILRTTKCCNSSWFVTETQGEENLVRSAVSKGFHDVIYLAEVTYRRRLWIIERIAPPQHIVCDGVR